MLVSANRQSEKDRIRAELDYNVNLKAQHEVTRLHQKIDRLENRMTALTGREQNRLPRTTSPPPIALKFRTFTTTREKVALAGGRKGSRIREISGKRTQIDYTPKAREAQMATSDVVGWVAFSITVIYTCIGLPIQVRKNYVSKSTSGLSLFMIVVLFLTFSVWIVYGAVKSPRDWFIIGSNVPGVSWVSVILYQFWLYRPGRNGFYAMKKV